MIEMSNPHQGYLCVFAERRQIAYHSHYVGGINNLAFATCPNCEHMLWRVITFDCSDSLLNLSDTMANHLPLLFCFNCRIANGKLFYVIKSSEEIDVVAYELGDDFETPYYDYPASFDPLDIELQMISEYAQDQIILFNKGEILSVDAPFQVALDVGLQHQVGGEPLLIQRNPDDYLVCPQCGSIMSFFATAGNMNSSAAGFWDNPWCQIVAFLCRRCNCVGLFAQAD